MRAAKTMLQKTDFPLSLFTTNFSLIKQMQKLEKNFLRVDMEEIN